MGEKVVNGVVQSPNLAAIAKEKKIFPNSILIRVMNPWILSDPDSCRNHKVHGSCRILGPIGLPQSVKALLSQ